MRTTIREACACGATLITESQYASEARKTADEWRESHKHAESVGICGDRPKVAGFPDHLPTPYCVLKAGHAGKHGDGDGAHWAHMPPEAAQNGTSRGPTGSPEGDSTTATENEPQREPER